MLPSPGTGFAVGGAPAAEVGAPAAEVGAPAAEVGALAAEVGALAAETCVGQGGSSARAAGNMPPSETTITIQNALERGMKSSIIMARDRKSTRLNSSHSQISYAVFCLKKKTKRPKS